MSALEHISDAELHLTRTTISYPDWKRKVDTGKYKDVKTTEWWKAFNELALAKADLAAGPPPNMAAAGLTYLFGDKEQ